MSYCRFENTLMNLIDCLDGQPCLADASSESEEKYKRRLIKLCKEIAKEYADEY